MNTYFKYLLTDQTANITTSPFVFTNPSGAVNFIAFGVFDSANVYLEWSIDNVLWTRFKQNGVDLVWTESGIQFSERIDFNSQIRVVIEDAGGSTSITFGYFDQ